jgi:hypothetical protein
LEKLTKSICSNCLIINIDPSKDLRKELKDQLGLYAPPMVAGMALYENGGSTGQYGVEVLFNGVAIHSPPMALSFVTNALLGQDKCKWLID